MDQSSRQRLAGCNHLELDDADKEPSLGSIEHGLSHFDQTRWAASATSDREEECEDEGTEWAAC